MVAKLQPATTSRQPVIPDGGTLAMRLTATFEGNPAWRTRPGGGAICTILMAGRGPILSMAVAAGLNERWLSDG
jgi:hypothetical protein